MKKVLFHIITVLVPVFAFGSQPKNVDQLLDFKDKIRNTDKLSQVEETIANDWLDWAVANNEDSLAYRLKLAIALCYLNMDKNYSAIPLFEDVFLNAKISTQDSYVVMRSVSKAYYNVQMYGKALEIHDEMRANPRFELQEEEIKYGGSFGDRIFLNAKEYRKARKMYYRFLDTAKKYNDNLIYASILNNLGLSYEYEEKYDSAIQYYNQSLKYIENIVFKDSNARRYDTFFYYVVLGNRAELKTERNRNYSNAIQIIKKTIDLGIQENDGRIVVGESLRMAEYYVQLEKVDSAIISYRLSLAYCKKFQQDFYFPKIFNGLANLYNIIGQKDSALYYKDKALAATENELNNKYQAAEFMLRAQRELQQKRDDLYRQKNKSERAKNELSLKKQQLRTAVIISGISLILMLSLISLVYDRRKKLQSLSMANKEILSKSKLLQSSIEEKDVLLKEIHHRVKNNMQIIYSLLDLQSNNIDDKVVHDIIKSGQNRIQSMALVHQLLYQKDNLGKLSFKTYIKELSDNLLLSYNSASNIKIHLEGIDQVFEIDTLLPLGLIINELVSNAIKHAFNNTDLGEIWISLEKQASNKYKLIIEDNGVGIDDTIVISKLNSLGLKLVTTLVKQIEGKLTYSTQAGTKFVVYFHR